MRKLSLFLLLASAAVPALAAPGEDNDGGRHHRDSDQTQQTENRPQRVREVQQQNNGGEQRNFRAERAQSNPDQAQQQERLQNREARQQRFEQAQQERAQNQQSIRESVQRHREEQAQNVTDRSDSVREWRQRDDSNATRTNWQGGQGSSWQDRQRRIRTIPNTNVVSGPSRTEQQAFQDRRRTDYRSGNYTRWTNNWRHDRRYDWNRYRNYHRSLFTLSYYSDPFGWNYRPWSIGSYLYPSYYRQSFWLNDPWQYRLPPAYGPYRWVRYWDDALLVNIYTGQVVDVEYDFFW
mgnify:CR=1 FL=1